MDTVNWRLKSEVGKRFGSQIEAAKALSMTENRLSHLIRGHVTPNEKELKALKETLGKQIVKEILPEERTKE